MKFRLIALFEAETAGLMSGDGNVDICFLVKETQVDVLISQRLAYAVAM